MKKNNISHNILINSLSVIIPCYCAEISLPNLVKQTILDAKRFTKNYEIILVDDCSPDKTGEVATLIAKDYKNIKVIHHKINFGLGKALWTGIQACQNDVIVWIPSDDQSLLKDQEELFKKIGESDIVLGYRSSRFDYALFRKILSYGYLLLLRIFFNLKFRDVNWTQVYKRKVFAKVKMKSFSPVFSTELIVKAIKHGFVISEAPAIYRSRSNGVTKMANLPIVFKMLKDLTKLRLGLFN